MDILNCHASPEREMSTIRSENTESDRRDLGKPLSGWRLKLYTVIFEADTRAGMWFDRALIVLILGSVAIVVADSMQSLHARAGDVFVGLEWIITIFFTVEYTARLLCVRHPLRYVFSFYGLVDLLAILPSYLAIFLPETHALIDVRILRLLRIFRILRLVQFVQEYQQLGHALRASVRKILVFLSVVVMVVLILGTLLYVVEGPENGFTSIPLSIYWAITTITTVGFGDITPKTDLGRLIASLMMLLGWGTLAVPTGIVTSEFTADRLRRRPVTTRTCHECLSEGHLPGARFCRDCGARLPGYQSEPEDDNR
jgi:voltage-gated potassium channel